ncbi:MAG: molybdopterin molybdotransferase MoeA [Candidatus Omnitrophica bacterium]|nr:molybdopterin molybdotransferase MoeA [Candidatus Omnitrophota bacterium]
MVSFQEAQKIIKRHAPAAPIEEIALLTALGAVCAQDVKSPVHLPLADNSAMDGFVLRSQDTAGATPDQPVALRIRGTIKAGDSVHKTLSPNETYRVMTGASILLGADAVLEKERAVIRNGHLVISQPLGKGKNIRYQAEEIEKGQLVLSKGSVLNPGGIGFLASMGMTRIKVYKKPMVSLIATGNELVTPGNPLAPGKIYDSNTAMITAALDQMRIRPFLVRKLRDEPRSIQKTLHLVLKESDFVILMGGVSVGDYDFVKEILGKEGVRTLFWKVSQKPGKPLYAGKKKNALVFGLPGNPASVFTCFYEYVYPALRHFMGHPRPYLAWSHRELKGSLRPDPDKFSFIKSKMENGQSVIPLQHQKSHMISSLCEADSFVVLPNSSGVLEESQMVLVHSLP